MRYLYGFLSRCLLLGGAVLLVSGCGPELTEEELGRVEYRFPSADELGDVYELPDLTPDKRPEEADKSADSESNSRSKTESDAESAADPDASPDDPRT